MFWGRKLKKEFERVARARARPWATRKDALHFIDKNISNIQDNFWAYSRVVKDNQEELRGIKKDVESGWKTAPEYVKGLYQQLVDDLIWDMAHTKGLVKEGRNKIKELNALRKKFEK